MQGKTSLNVKKNSSSAVASRALQAVQKDDGAVNAIKPTDIVTNLDYITVNHNEASEKGVKQHTRIKHIISQGDG